ncbi:MAG: ribosome silencing factor [Rhodospirillaceae bacterium]|nr:ribosome silencing factor [Rhodospirillaceae bacterium]OUU24336.1 MAG: ribosome silencing factor [Candidatus Endolissoclinum sp. TMED37]
MKKQKTKKLNLLNVVISSLEEFKAQDIVKIDLIGKTSMADSMLIASGTSSRQIRAIAENTVAEIKKSSNVNVNIEGLSQSDWVLIDAGDIIIHLFRPEVREFYNLEKMWQVDSTEDASTETIEL